MAKQRIRSVKPELFQHEGLYQLERETCLPIRLAFIGLFTACDREGRFEWKPNVLKLWIMPWDEVDFELILGVLARSGHVRKYEIAGKHYGCIPSWKKHQVINGRESASVIPSDASVTCESRVESREQVTRCFGGGTEQNRTEQNRTDLNGREGMQGKGNREASNLSVLSQDEEELARGQATLIRLRMEAGLNPNGTSDKAWNEVRG